jgi:hypothetical protein
MDNREQLGYLTALIENHIKNNDEYFAGVADFRKVQDARLDAQDAALKKIQEELSMYKTIIKTFKFLFGACVALLTFKWAVVIELWQHFKAG